MKLEKILDENKMLCEKYNVLSDELITKFIEEYSDVLEALA